MVQNIDEQLYDEFWRVIKENMPKKSMKVVNNHRPLGDWMQKVCENVSISELASEFGIEQCPECNYGLELNDACGSFVCVNAKYSKKQNCNFSGNIVDFMERFG